MENELKIIPNSVGGTDVFLNGEQIDNVLSYSVSEQDGKKTATLTIALSKIEINSGESMSRNLNDDGEFNF